MPYQNMERYLSVEVKAPTCLCLQIEQDLYDWTSRGARPYQCKEISQQQRIPGETPEGLGCCYKYAIDFSQHCWFLVILRQRSKPGIYWHCNRPHRDLFKLS